MDALPLHRPSVRQLEYLVAVADELHFGRAARSCAVTQPALSAQVRLVEELLGVQVFERSKRRVLVTPAGSQVIEHARRCLSAVDALVEDARRASEPLSGPLRLGVIPTIAPYLLPAVLPRVRKQHPKLELVLREEQTRHLVESVESGALDLGLLALPVEEADLVELPLYDEPFQLVAREDHPLVQDKAARIPESALKGEEVLLLEDGHCLRAQALEVCRRAGVNAGRIQATSLNTLVQMVAGGLGVTLLPERAQEVELRHGSGLACKAFRKPEPVRTVGLAWRQGAAREHEYRLLAETLAEAARPVGPSARKARARKSA
ncbi:MAG: LysR substrate-binding domain-containing protein [Myxococcota bacterium]|nr:LysR substrate-binding domain-containing protein [Myxococcota bacterium]